MRRLLTLVVVAVLMTSGCTNDKGGPTPSSVGSSGASSSAPPLAKGVYGWNAYGVNAILTPGDGSWSLKIKNTSGEKIGAPGIYALASDDGHKVDATVDGAKPLADGESATLDVTWPADFNAHENSGMIILMIGSDLYGGFERGR